MPDSAREFSFRDRLQQATLQDWDKCVVVHLAYFSFLIRWVEKTQKKRVEGNNSRSRSKRQKHFQERIVFSHKRWSLSFVRSFHDQLLIRESNLLRVSFCWNLCWWSWRKFSSIFRACGNIFLEIFWLL